MKMRRLISAIIALLLVVNLSVTAFAAEWYLEDGDITVSAGDSGQTVSQGSSTGVADNAPVIKQRDSSKTTDSTITISTSDNATANVTIQDINISSTGDAIDVGSSSANITLEGDNKIYSESGSALHVSDGDVTITGGEMVAIIQGRDPALVEDAYASTQGRSRSLTGNFEPPAKNIHIVSEPVSAPQLPDGEPEQSGPEEPPAQPRDDETPPPQDREGPNEKPEQDRP